jgi:hypothetical protein
MKRKHTITAGMCALGASLVLYTACNFVDELLVVENPEELITDVLDDFNLKDVQVNGVVALFKTAYDSPHIEYGSMHTDEHLDGVNWEGTARQGQRILHWAQGEGDQIFEQTSKALRTGHNLAEQIRLWAVDDSLDLAPGELDEDLATVLVFTGYAVVAQAEMMCQTVVSPDPDNPDSIIHDNAWNYNHAEQYLTEALSIATANGFDDIANLARTGLARAHLGQAEWAEAAAAANAVTAGFEWWMEYLDQDNGRNPLQNSSYGGNFFMGINPLLSVSSTPGVHPSFDGTGFVFEDEDIIDPQTDPRIQHWPSPRTGHNALTPLYKLFQGLRYDGYSGMTIAPQSVACPNCTPDTDGNGLGWDVEDISETDLPLVAWYSTDILLADYVEAQHHYWEAIAMQSQNEVGVLAFVNARRAVGNQAAVALTYPALRTELRNQRGRDLFLGGFRTGDLRRWTVFDAGNGPFAAGSYFPTGTHPVSQWGDYGVWTCFPIPRSEYEGNPNLTPPADPSVPPNT